MIIRTLMFQTVLSFVNIMPNSWSNHFPILETMLGSFSKWAPKILINWIIHSDVQTYASSWVRVGPCDLILTNWMWGGDSITFKIRLPKINVVSVLVSLFCFLLDHSVGKTTCCIIEQSHGKAPVAGDWGLPVATWESLSAGPPVVRSLDDWSSMDTLTTALQKTSSQEEPSQTMPDSWFWKLWDNVFILLSCEDWGALLHSNSWLALRKEFTLFKSLSLKK